MFWEGLLDVLLFCCWVEIEFGIVGLRDVGFTVCLLVGVFKLGDLIFGRDW